MVLNEEGSSKKEDVLTALRLIGEYDGLVTRDIVAVEADAGDEPKDEIYVSLEETHLITDIYFEELHRSINALSGVSLDCEHLTPEPETPIPEPDLPEEDSSVDDSRRAETLVV